MLPPPSSDEPSLELEVLCGATFSLGCRCALQPHPDTFPHVCTCRGSWRITEGGEVDIVAWPSLVIEPGGPYPVGTELPAPDIPLGVYPMDVARATRLLGDLDTLFRWFEDSGE